jgi:hypothetical protein
MTQHSKEPDLEKVRLMLILVFEVIRLLVALTTKAC